MSADIEIVALEVAPVVAPSPLVLIDGSFLRSLAEVEARAQSLIVTDAKTAQEAADLQRRITTAAQQLEKARTALKQPFLDQGRKIDEAAKAPGGRIEAAKRLVQAQLTNFAMAEQRRLAEIERQRVAEINRLQAIARREREDAEKAAAELAAKATAEQRKAADDDGFGEVAMEPVKTETEKAIEAVQFAPAPVAAKPIGVAFRVTLRHEITDLAKLPDAFVIRSANDKAIRAMYCAPWKDGMPLPEVPGVVFSVDRTPVSTGGRF